MALFSTLWFGLSLVAYALLRPSPAVSQPSADTTPSDSAVIQPPTPTPPVTLPTVVAKTLPGQVLDLSHWKLTLPIDTAHAGHPDEIEQPELASFTDARYFYLNSTKTGVNFRAPAHGATTKNSNYPRSELREMSQTGTTEASWSNASGTHELLVRQAITHLPDVKSEVVVAQIHDETDDIVMVRLEGAHLFVERDGKNIGDLDTAYKLGSIFSIRITAERGTITVVYNEAAQVTTNREGNGYYFKAGCYTQTNASKGDSASSYGEVTIYRLTVTHR